MSNQKKITVDVRLCLMRQSLCLESVNMLMDSIEGITKLKINCHFMGCDLQWSNDKSDVQNFLLPTIQKDDVDNAIDNIFRHPN